MLADRRGTSQRVCGRYSHVFNVTARLRAFRIPPFFARCVVDVIPCVSLSSIKHPAFKPGIPGIFLNCIGDAHRIDGCRRCQQVVIVYLYFFISYAVIDTVLVPYRIHINVTSGVCGLPDALSVCINVFLLFVVKSLKVLNFIILLIGVILMKYVRLHIIILLNKTMPQAILVKN